ncbi:Cof-type HAD-IIB family hydrolase [Chamaesiphon minutus]|uniref:HAD-superfamily hydrolase, subfamily IIB n=1 Tax=Chamaesiphon minutus (strain ATCC 27169 / PCC 6605) TaxID=1173020 RepID=K9UJ55_CHAP6|nr:Cof-type HAD-IIB family hydrolase [Chamaesiphon minutus]AFY94815.1 HAD-superfamily hydrolase, subfamily IIB [Chamaesiphon minutus PCC 6605]
MSSLSTAEIKLLILDIDGTIAGKSNQVSTRVKQAIQAAQAKGVRVGIATGRMYKSAMRFHNDIGADMPLIAYQGAWIQDPATGKRYRHHPVPVAIARELIDYFEQPDLLDRLSVHVYRDDCLYVREINADTELYVGRSGIEVTAVKDLRTLLTDCPTKLLAMSEDTALIQDLLVDLRQRYAPSDLHVTTSVPIFLETTHSGANKGAAIDYLATSLLNITAENVLAIGDNYNDVEMLGYAGIGVAMGNAPSDVQSLADWVAPDIEADGVAATIEKFILNTRSI